MSQDDIDMCDFCDSAGSDDTGGATDGGNTFGGMMVEQQMVEMTVEVQEEECLDDNGVPVPLDDPNYDTHCVVVIQPRF